MIEQRVENRSLQGWRGFALVLVVAVAIIFVSNFFYMLERRIGHAASVLFIALGCAVAWFLLEWYVKGFKYVCDGGLLRVSRTYGKRERFMLEVWLSGVSACGSLEDMKRRFPGAKVRRAAKHACPIEPLAVAYNEAGKQAILVIQPEERLKRIIVDAVKK